MHIVIPVLSTQPSGGFRMLCELSREWIASGCRVTFVAPSDAGSPYFQTPATFLFVNGNGELRDTPGDGVAVRGAAGVWRRFGELRHAMARLADDADVMLANHALTSWPVALTRTRARKFYYVQAYEPEDYFSVGRPANYVLGSIAYASYWLPLQQVVNSPTYVGYRNLRADTWIPAGVDLQKMRPAANRAPLDGRPFVFGCLGRPEPFKGTAHVVSAFDTLVARGRNVRLRIAHGHFPPGRPQPDGCEIVKARNDAELVAFYQSLDALVAPATIHLGAPHCPVMEAMACRVAVVSTGAIPASRDADNAWIVAPSDPTGIADALDDIQFDAPTRERRLSKAMQDIQAFSWSVIAPRMLALFKA
jgi:glycosyltransferase involved in cell wall biosynthesis